MLAVPATVAESVSPPAEPALRIQLLPGVVSPKSRLPTVLAPSRVTVASALRSKVEKLATAETPLGIVSQLAASLQLPPSGLFQTDARATPAPSIKQPTRTQARTAAAPNGKGIAPPPRVVPARA